MAVVVANGMDCNSEAIWKDVESARQNIRKAARSGSTDLLSMIQNCYSEQNCSDERFRADVNVLHKLPRDSFHISLIVSLFSDEKGYSLMLNPTGSRKEVFLPYEDNEIFSYLDGGQIPPVLLEVLENSQYCQLYNGNIVCEVRNYRGCVQLDQDHQYQSTLLLLSPTSESLQATVNRIAKENNCTKEERLQVESQLLLTTQAPLCLEPSTDVVCVSNRLHYNKRKFHRQDYRRYLQRRCHARRARIALYSERNAPRTLRLHSFLNQHKMQGDEKKVLTVDAWRAKKMDVTFPESDIDQVVGDVAKYAKSLMPEILRRTEIHSPQPSKDVPPSPTTTTTTTTVQTPTRPPSQPTMVDELLANGRTTPSNKPKPGPPTPAKMVVPSSLAQAVSAAMTAVATAVTSTSVATPALPTPAPAAGRPHASMLQQVLLNQLMSQAKPPSVPSAIPNIQRPLISSSLTGLDKARVIIQPIRSHPPPTVKVISTQPPSALPIPRSSGVMLASPAVRASGSQPSVIPNVPISQAPPKLLYLPSLRGSPQSANMPTLKPLDPHKQSPPHALNTLAPTLPPPPQIRPPMVPAIKKPVGPMAMPVLHKMSATQKQPSLPEPKEGRKK